MKKHLLILIAIILIVTLTSCASKKNIDLSKTYIDEYYQNFSEGKSSECFYQLNKNSVDILENAYLIGAEDFLSSRSSILGPVKNYEIQNETYVEDEDNHITDFDITVNYEKATVNEKIQIIIKKDGQTSINIIEFAEDNIIKNLITNYMNTMLANDTNAVVNMISPYYFTQKRKRDFEDMVEQINTSGGKLSGSEVIEGNNIYEKLEEGSFVYEVLIKMNYENMPILNKIKIMNQNGNLGIGSIVMIPEKLSLFLDDYQTKLNEGNKEEILELYSDKLWSDGEDVKDAWWARLILYSETYGNLQDYEVLSIGADTQSQADGTEIEILRVDVNMIYEQKTISNKLILLITDEYKINEQFFNDN